jgi:TPR repeat protein
LYEQGNGVDQNFDKAEQWYRLAAKQGNAEAQGKLKELLSKKVK